MPFRIEEEFQVEAPVQRVWEFLIDPARVVVCLPGAELLETQGDRTFAGAVKVKVGPVVMSYKGLVKFTEVDEENHEVRITGEGREAGGAGSAKVSMLSRVAPLESGGSGVVVTAEVDLVGKVVQFGRGMIEEVSRQMFRQFAACAKKQLELADSPEMAVEAPAAEKKPVSAAGVGLRALWAVIVRSVKRLFGVRSS